MGFVFYNVTSLVT